MTVSYVRARPMLDRPVTGKTARLEGLFRLGIYLNLRTWTYFTPAVAPPDSTHASSLPGPVGRATSRNVTLVAPAVRGRDVSTPANRKRAVLTGSVGHKSRVTSYVPALSTSTSQYP